MAVVRDALSEQLLEPLLVVQRRLYPQIRGARQDALRERQDALDIEFVDRLGVPALPFAGSAPPRGRP